jgi:hypothetical protein
VDKRCSFWLASKKWEDTLGEVSNKACI